MLPEKTPDFRPSSRIITRKTRTILNVSDFSEFQLDDELAEEVKASWHLLIETEQAQDVLGRAIFSTFFDVSSESRKLFMTSMTAFVSKFMNALRMIVSAIHNPAALMQMAENIGFMHLNVDVTIPAMMALRESVLHVFQATLSPRFSQDAQEGWHQLLDYVGGAMIYVRNMYADRVGILQGSWQRAQAGSSNGTTNQGMTKAEGHDEAHSSPRSPMGSPRSPRIGPAKGDRSGTRDDKADGVEENLAATTSRLKKAMSNAMGGGFLNKIKGGIGNDDDNKEQVADSPSGSGELSDDMNMMKLQQENFTTSFEEMFSITATVMGVKKTSLLWMQEVLDAFDALVVHTQDRERFREECDVLVLRISRYDKSAVNLKQFRNLLLAALRSLLPKEWSSAHEDAWDWMCDCVANSLSASMHKPIVYEEAYGTVLLSLDDNMKLAVWRDIYIRFFEMAPTGQNYFKQSNTRLHFIADRVLEMCLEIYQRPKQLVSEISALGLRHVGFGIPTSLFPPFVEACVEALGRKVDDQLATEAFQWSVRLVAKILVRTILEGSTVVMKSINANSVLLLQKAIASAPRKFRATWLLDVQVGDQHISPLAWSIESGSLKVTEAILRDLLTIRADRARYYYGMEEMWQRHPDIVKKLQEEAPMLLGVLLEGLIWRSHRTIDGIRRVNYYIKRVLVNQQGKFADALECVSGTGDPTLVSHPTVAVLADHLWSGVVVRSFISSRMWNVFSLTVFIFSQEVLPSWNGDDVNDQSVSINWLIFAGRVFNYTIGMGRLAMFHLSRIWLWCRNTMRRIIKEIDTDGNGEIDYDEMCEALHKFKDTVKEEVAKAVRALREDGPTVDEAKKAIANREKNMYNIISFLLLVNLGVMLSHEPMFWCAGAGGWPTEFCEKTGSPNHTEPIKYRYSIFASSAMIVHWFLLIDWAVFSTEISAFILVMGHVLAEVKQFLTALGFLLLAFGSAISIWCHNCPEYGGNFGDMLNAIISLFAITVGLYQGDYRDMREDPLLLGSVSLFVTISSVLLLNLLVAQLNRSYEYIYKDMLGFARLNRASLLVDAMESCSLARWNKFVNSLKFDQRIEFDEGDLGLSGGVSSWEPSHKCIQTRESIRRYGGTTSPEIPWPQEHSDSMDRQEGDQMDVIEDLVSKIQRRVSKLAQKRASEAATRGSKLSVEYTHSLLLETS